MRDQYKVLTEKYNTIYESIHDYMGPNTAEIERLRVKILTCDTFEDFKNTYSKLYLLEREALRVMPAPPYVTIYDFVKDKPELGGITFKNSPGESLYNATTYLNTYFELEGPMYKHSAAKASPHLTWAEENWNRWYTAYKLWKDAQAELYKDNPGINIDI